MTNLTQSIQTTNSNKTSYEVEYYGLTQGKHHFCVFDDKHESEHLLTDDELLNAYQAAKIIDEHDQGFATITYASTDCFCPEKGHYEISNAPDILNITQLIDSIDPSNIKSQFIIGK